MTGAAGDDDGQQGMAEGRGERREVERGKGNQRETAEGN
jgi:hypothetical protein